MLILSSEVRALLSFSMMSIIGLAVVHLVAVVANEWIQTWL